MRKPLVALYLLSASSFLVALGVAVMSHEEALTLWANRAQVFSVLLILLTFVVQSASHILSRGSLTPSTTGDILASLSSVSPRSSFTLGNLNEGDTWEVEWKTVSKIKTQIGSKGTVAELARIIAKTPARALVVLGDQGSGKTQLAGLAVQAYAGISGELARRRLPVRVYLGSWNSESSRFVDWVAMELSRMSSQAGIPLRQSRRNLIRFVLSDQMLMVFDGFDELGEKDRRAALAALSRMPLAAFVLLSRKSEFEEERSHLVIPFDCVHLLNLTVVHAAESLSDSTSDQGWRDLASSLVSKPESVVAAVLVRPLFLSVACELAAREVPVPNLFLEKDESSCESLLLRTFVEKVVLLGRRPLTPENGFKPISAKHLKTVADAIHKGDNENFLWWDLYRVVPWWQLVPLTWFVGSGATLLVMWILSLIDRGFFGPPSLVGALALGALPSTVLATSGSPAERITPLPRRAALRVFIVVASIAVAVALVEGLRSGGLDQPPYVLATSFLFLLLFAAEVACIAWIVFGVRLRINTLSVASWPAWLQSIIRPSEIVYRGSPRDVGWIFTWTKFLVPFILALLAYGAIIISSTPALGGMLDLRPPEPLLGFGLFMLAAVLPNFLALSFGRVRVRKRLTVMIAGNVVFGLVRGTLVGFAVMSTTISFSVALTQGPKAAKRELLAGGFPYESWLLIPVLSALVLVLSLFTFGVAGAVLTSGSRFALAWLRLVLTGRLPLGLGRTLEVAQEFGLLRRSGSGYTFRHPRLREAMEDILP